VLENAVACKRRLKANASVLRTNASPLPSFFEARYATLATAC
jgi:hypothetical protein